MGMLLRVVLHRGWRAAVGVALTQNRVYGAALDLVVTGFHVTLFVVGWLLGIIGELVALGLQLLDGRLHLRQ